MAQAKVKFIKKYDKKWGIGLEGIEGLNYSFDTKCENIQVGDTIVYELQTSGKYTNLVLTGEVPERDISEESQSHSTPQPQQASNRDASIVAQNLINRATDRYIAERDTSALTTPEEANSEIKRHCEFYIGLYHEAREKI